MVLKRRPTSPAACTPGLHLRRQAIEVHVAGVALVPHAADADLRLLQVRVGQADAVQHRLRRALAAGLGDARGVFVQLDQLPTLPRGTCQVRERA